MNSTDVYVRCEASPWRRCGDGIPALFVRSPAGWTVRSETFACIATDVYVRCEGLQSAL
jgi:hypothetical protein